MAENGDDDPPTPAEEQFLNIYCNRNDLEGATRYLEELERNNPQDIKRKLLQCGGLFGYTPLHEAASAGYREIVLMLLKYDPYMEAENGYVNIKTNNGYSALHLAAARGHAQLARELIEWGAEFDCNDEFGKTPLGHCEISARFDTQKIMLSAAIIHAARTDNVKRMKYLFNKSSLNVEKDCLREALTTSIDRDNPDIVAMLMDRGRCSGEVKITEALHQSKDNRKHHARAMLLMLLAVKDKEYQLVLRLFGMSIPQYSHTWITDEDFPHVQRTVLEGKIPTSYAILACDDQESRVFEELLIRTEVHPEEKRVSWMAFGLERVKLSWLRHINWVVHLQLNHNRIRSLPGDLQLFLRNTVYAHLDHNDLKAIPSALLELPSLRELNLAHNQLKCLPKSQVWSAELQVLNISHNKLQSLPLHIESFRLKWLDLGNNQLSTALEVLGTLEKLEYLNLEFNTAIERLPKELGRLQFLKTFKINGLTNLVDPPKTMLTEETNEIIRYLDAKLKSARPYYRMKLMLVGQAARGKTTLAKRLLRKNVKESDNKSTVGIEVNEWVYKKGEQSIRFTLWDFGGQEVYYATHQCFLTKRSLYLLLWRMTDFEKGIEEIKHWLDNIAMRVPRSRVIIVGTHFDKLPPEEKDHVSCVFDEIGILAEKYNGKTLQIDKITYVALHGAKDNLDHLMDLIYDQAVNQYLHPDRYPNNIGKRDDLLILEKVPESYQALDAHLMSPANKKQSKGVPILHYSEYKELVRKLGKSDLYTDSEIHAATDFLHQIGSILHFNDRKNNLDDLYFMDPHWLFDVMSAVITVKERNPYVKHGVIESQCLKILYKTLLKESGSEAFLNQFVVLLDRFEIVLPLDQQRTSFLIPSMLPSVKPPNINNPTGAHCLQRHIVFMDNLTPPGFWCRMIARIIHSVPCVREIVETRTVVQCGSLNMLSNTSHAANDGSLSSFLSSKSDSDIYLLSPISPPRRQESLSPRCSITTDNCELKFWNTGLFYRENSQKDCLFFRVESLEGASGVSITTVADAGGIQIYGQITDICDKHLLEWYNRTLFNVEHRIPCCECQQEDRVPVDYFVKQAIIDELDRRGGLDTILQCKNGHKKPISDIAPDIFLGDVNHKFLLKVDDIQYSEDNVLGKGGFGKVYRGVCRSQDVAVKIYAKGVSLDLQELRNEATILQSCHHPSLAGMVGVIIQPPRFYLVLELAPGGSLKKPFVQSSKPISRVVLFRVASQIVAGLDFLHRSSYIFRDLKADNILLWSLRLNNLINCKLTDFGMVTEVAPSGARRFGGTVGFMAPEVISADRPAYDQSADTFSLSMVLYQMLARRNPYESIKKKGSHLVNSAIEKGQLPELSDIKVTHIGLPYFALLMKRCWVYKPECRPRMSDLLPHLCNPLVQLTIGARIIHSQFSLRDACIRLYHEDNTKETTEVSDPIPTVELWVCLDGNKGAEIQVFNGESLRHLNTFLVGTDCQECCMCLHDNLLWVATREGLGDSKVDVFDAHSKNHKHTVWMRDCGPSCFLPDKKDMYIGTQEGCVFVLNVSTDATSKKNRQKYLSDFNIHGLAIVGKDLWVSQGNLITIHSCSSLKQKPKTVPLVLPCDRPHLVGELALQGDLVWGVHTKGVCISGWSVEERTCLFVRHIHSMIESNYPTKFSEACVITAHCTALDVLWIGLDTGQILLLSMEGDVLLLLHPFSSRIRFLTCIPSLGPCRSEKSMILVGGKGFRQIPGLDLDLTDQDEGYHLNLRSGKVKKPSSSTALEDSPPNNILLLLEAVEAFHAKQIDLLQSARAWDSYNELEYFELEVKRFDHLKHENLDPEFPPDPLEGEMMSNITTPSEVQERLLHSRYRRSFSDSSSSMSTLDPLGMLNSCTLSKSPSGSPQNLSTSLQDMTDECSKWLDKDHSLTCTSTSSSEDVCSLVSSDTQTSPMLQLTVIPSDGGVEENHKSEHPLGWLILESEVIPMVTAKWKKFGIGLGIPKCTLDSIGKNYRGDPDKCRAVLREWMRTCAAAEVTWERVTRAMEDCGLTLQAKKLKEHLRGKNISPSRMQEIDCDHEIDGFVLL